MRESAGVTGMVEVELNCLVGESRKELGGGGGRCCCRVFKLGRGLTIIFKGTSEVLAERGERVGARSGASSLSGREQEREACLVRLVRVVRYAEGSGGSGGAEGGAAAAAVVSMVQ